jgi:hypothetical protein
MLVVLVAMSAVGLSVGWINRLSEEERRILGRWYRRLPPNSVFPGGALIVNDYSRNRTCSIHAIDERTGAVRERTDGRASAIRGWWVVRDGKLIYTYDLNLGLLDRARRLLPAGFPGAWPVEPDTYPIERLTADELIVRDRLDNTIRMTRTPPD